VKKACVRVAVVVTLIAFVLIALSFFLLEGMGMGARWIHLGTRYYYEVEVGEADLHLNYSNRSWARPSGEAHYAIERVWNYRTWELRVSSLKKVDEGGRTLYSWREGKWPEPVAVRIDDYYSCKVELSGNRVDVVADNLENVLQSNRYPPRTLVAILTFDDNGKLLTATLKNGTVLEGETAESSEEVSQSIGMLTELDLHDFAKLPQLSWFHAMVERYGD